MVGHHTSDVLLKGGVALVLLKQFFRFRSRSPMEHDHFVDVARPLSLRIEFGAFRLNGRCPQAGRVLMRHIDFSIFEFSVRLSPLIFGWLSWASYPPVA